MHFLKKFAIVNCNSKMSFYFRHKISWLEAKNRCTFFDYNCIILTFRLRMLLVVISSH
jgi:hypothetical protein